MTRDATSADGLTEGERKMLAHLETLDYSVLDPIVDEFKMDSDRAAVIVGAAQLDDLLRQMIERALLPRSGKDDRLLEVEGALRSFSSRTEAAHRLGLISSSLASALDQIRKVRNAFAHDVTVPPSLGESPHREHAKLVYETISKRMPSPTFWDVLVRRYGERSPATEFRAAITALCHFLYVDLQFVQRLPVQGQLMANWP